MPKYPSHKGGITTALLAVIAVGALMLASISSYDRFGSSRTEPTPPPPTRADLINTLGRLGLTPEALAAVGVNGQTAAQVIADVREHLPDLLPPLQAAEARYVSTKRERERLMDLVRRGMATEADRTAYQQSRTALIEAEAERQTRLQALRSAATSRLTEQQRAALAAICSCAFPEIPVQYRLASRTSAQWTALRDALINQSIASRRDQTLDAASRAVIAEANAAAATASANLQANRDAVNLAWQRATAE